MKLKKDVAGVVTLAEGESMGGSPLHRSGRCKPCAFFHTKGCQNDKKCQFCHLCPPGEKQRRKRLREQPPGSYARSLVVASRAWSERQKQRQERGQCLQKPTASTKWTSSA